MVRPVYAPALVAWVGGGPGFHFSVGVGVAWFPLAPGEVFIPGYRVSRAYVNSVNITNTAVNVTRVTNVYNTVVVNRNFEQHHLCEPECERRSDGGFARDVREWRGRSHET